jgi:glycosyltransferase involved in cell wall biosynthesis
LTDIVLVRTSSWYESRLVRIIRSLSKKYSIHIIGWNREGMEENVRSEILKKTFVGNKADFEVLRLRAPYGRPSLIHYLPLLFYFPIFWTWVFAKLVIYKPKVVHSFDLDTVLPCYIYKKIFRKKLVFEVVDRYAMTFVPRKYRLLYSMLCNFEEGFSKRADLLLTVSEGVLKSFHNKPKESAVILNCPEDHFVDTNERIKKSALTVLYGGPVKQGRGLEDIAMAIEKINNIEFYIYGQIIDRKLFEKIISLPKVKYKGFLRVHDDYQNAIVNADIIIAIYTQETPSHHITMQNKTLEAMMCGIPIITNFSSEFVNEIGFGIIVEYGNIDQIRSAITRLRDDPELRKRLGSNGRKAFLQKYNWGIMEKKLYDVYSELI